jgi:hypothetical protein
MFSSPLKTAEFYKNIRIALLDIISKDKVASVSLTDNDGNTYVIPNIK